MTRAHQRIALVTGAAGGIGMALTTRLIAADYHVLMLDINVPGLAEAKQRFGDSVTAVECDLADPGSIVSAAGLMRESFASIDVIVNNAGVITPGPFIDTPPQAIERQIQINLVGPLRILNVFLPMVRRPGSVVNVISMAGILPLKDSAVYSAGKFGLRGFTLALAMELKERGIRVSGVYPSSVDTPMLEREAQSGGSPLNFIAEPLSPGRVVDFIMRAIREGGMEYYVPFSDSLLSRLAMMVPWSLPRLLPHFEKKGAAGQQRYLARIAAKAG
jgi:NAD(P)-dependent dehydrogenase (short-subunit alcohol dehydrogenase family)